MNPILQHLKHRAPQQGNQGNENVTSLIEGIKNGSIDPREEALRRLENSSPQMKAKLKTALPMLGTLAKKYGIAESEVQSFSKAIQDKL